MVLLFILKFFFCRLQMQRRPAFRFDGLMLLMRPLTLFALQLRYQPLIPPNVLLISASLASDSSLRFHLFAKFSMRFV